MPQPRRLESRILSFSAASPVLDAYRDGDDVHLWAWCEHEHRWHRHGSGDNTGDGDGHRGAHCACPDSPYSDDGYVLREVGLLTDEILGQHVEQQPCPVCAYDDERCACGVPVCAECGCCSRHAGAECLSCWGAFGDPGFAVCRRHGMVRAHPHDSAGLCGGDEASCDLAFGVVAYWPAREDESPHVHCPLCWVILTELRGPAVPRCMGCLALVDVARATAELDAVHAGMDALRAGLIRADIERLTAELAQLAPA